MCTPKRIFKRFCSLVLIGLLFLNAFGLSAAYNFPDPTPKKYVNDYAGVIDEASARQMISLGYELEQKTGAQAIVVTVSSLNGIPIEDYANQLFRSWGIGQANKDNGFLILLSINDHRWRVEIGRGLEGAIPDVLSNQIMEDLAKPDFMENNYGTGLSKAYSQFCDTIGSEYDITLTHSLGTILPHTPTVPISHRNNYLGLLAIITFVIMDLLLNRGRIFSFVLQMLFWNSFYHRGGRGGPRGGGGGGFGGFGGGSSNGGGSSGGW